MNENNENNENNSSLQNASAFFILAGMVIVVCGVWLRWGFSAGLIAWGCIFFVYGVLLAQANALDRERLRKDKISLERITKS